MLSNFQFGNQALLQSFLIGQPEFREILQRPEMEQFRQRVAATCQGKAWACWRETSSAANNHNTPAAAAAQASQRVGQHIGHCMNRSGSASPRHAMPIRPKPQAAAGSVGQAK